MDINQKQQEYFTSLLQKKVEDYLLAVVNDYSGEDSPEVCLREMKEITGLAKLVLNTKEEPEEN